MEKVNSFQKSFDNIVSAHSMDTSFLGLDENDNLVVFYTFEDGVVPSGATTVNFAQQVLTNALASPEILYNTIDMKNPENVATINTIKSFPGIYCTFKALPYYVADITKHDPESYLKGEFDWAFNALRYKKARLTPKILASEFQKSTGVKISPSDIPKINEVVKKLLLSSSDIELYRTKSSEVFFTEEKDGPLLRYFSIYTCQSLDLLLSLFTEEITEKFWNRFAEEINKATVEIPKLLDKKYSISIQKFSEVEYRTLILCTKLLIENKKESLTSITIAYPEILKEFKKRNTLVIDRQYGDKDLFQFIDKNKKLFAPYIIEVPFNIRFLDTTLRNALGRITASNRRRVQSF